jgi:hypothetical protein
MKNLSKIAVSLVALSAAGAALASSVNLNADNNQYSGQTLTFTVLSANGTSTPLGTLTPNTSNPGAIANAKATPSVTGSNYVQVTVSGSNGSQDYCSTNPINFDSNPTITFDTTSFQQGACSQTGTQPTSQPITPVAPATQPQS